MFRTMEDYGGLLLSVAKLAFHGLTASRKDEALVFKERTLLAYFNCSPKEEFKVCLKIGLLSKSDISSVVRKEISVTFYHKLFQEFFSAVWVVCSEEAFKKLCEHCHSLSILEDMQNIYIFMCGIDPRIGSRFSKHVANLCSAESSVQFWRLDTNIDCTNTPIVSLTDIHLKCANAIKRSSNFSDEVLCAPDVYLSRVASSNILDELFCGTTLDDAQMLLSSTRYTLTCLRLESVDLKSNDEWYLLLKSICCSKNLRMLYLCFVVFGRDYICDNDDDDFDDDFYNNYDDDDDDDDDDGSNIMNQLDFEIPSKCILERVTFAVISFNLVPLLTMLLRTNTVCGGTKDTESTGTLLHLQIEKITLTTAEWCLLTRIVNESPSLQTFEMTEIETDSRSTTLFSIYPPLVPCSLQNITIGGNSRVFHIRSDCFFLDTNWVPLYQFFRRLLTAITITNMHKRITLQETSSLCGVAPVVAGTLVQLELQNIGISLYDWHLLEEIVNVAPTLRKFHLKRISYQDGGIEICLNKQTLPISIYPPCRLQSVVITGVGLRFQGLGFPYMHDVSSVPLLQILHRLAERHDLYLETNVSGIQGVKTNIGSPLTELRIEFVCMAQSEWTLLLKVLCRSSSLKTLSLVHVIVGNDKNNQNHAIWDPCSSAEGSTDKKEKTAELIYRDFPENRYPALEKVYLKENSAPIEQLLPMLQGASGVKQLEVSGKINCESEFVAMILGMQGLEKIQLKDMYLGTKQLDLSKHVRLEAIELKSFAFGEQEMGIAISEYVKVLELHDVKMSALSWHELFGFPLVPLHIIKCGSNSITELSSTATTNIKSLTLSEMDFRENILDLSKCVSLQELNLTEIIFRTHLNLEKNTCLKVLKLDNVNMSSDTWIHFFESIHDLTSLESVHLRGCNIEPDKIKWPKHFPTRAIQTS